MATPPTKLQNISVRQVYATARDLPPSTYPSHPSGARSFSAHEVRTQSGRAFHGGGYNPISSDSPTGVIDSRSTNGMHGGGPPISLQPPGYQADYTPPRAVPQDTRAGIDPTTQAPRLAPSNTHFQLRVLTSDHPNIEPTNLQALTKAPPPPIRIIFAPTDIPTPTNTRDLSALHSAFNVPPAYLEERQQAVTYAFGARPTSSWLHFLSKNVSLHHGSSGLDIAGPAGRDDTWVKGGWFMTWRPQDGGYHVNLVACGYFPGLETRLREFLKGEGNVGAVGRDPFALWVPVLTELWKVLDDVVWGVLTVFAGVEEKILRLSAAASDEDFEIDFQMLHNLAKHIIHLKESSDAVLCTMDRVEKTHAKLFSSGDAEVAATQMELGYVAGLYKATNVRLESMEKKVGNCIGLAFNLVAQQDSRRAREESRRMIKDSATMRVIATVTMVFLPGTAVATMFGSNFFAMHEDGVFVISKGFWLFWAVCIPLSALTLFLWKMAARQRKL